MNTHFMTDPVTPSALAEGEPSAAAGPDPSAAPPRTGKRPKLSCRTVILSDIHLGTLDSKAAEVVEFLKHIQCSKLVLNGDIIDGWALKRGGRWTSSHSRVIRKIIKNGSYEHRMK